MTDTGTQSTSTPQTQGPTDEPERPPTSAAQGDSRNVFRAAVLVAMLGIIAYYNGQYGQFMFDDGKAVVTNPSIRHLWPLGPVLSPPADKGETVGGRPLVNLSLAVNYALRRPERPGISPGQPGDPPAGGPDAIGHRPKDPPAAAPSREVRLGRPGPGDGRGDPLDRPPDADRIGLVHLAAGGIDDGAVLSPDALLRDSLRGVEIRSLAGGGGAGLLAGDGQQGSDGFCAGDGAAVRPDVPVPHVRGRCGSGGSCTCSWRPPGGCWRPGCSRREIAAGPSWKAAPATRSPPGGRTPCRSSV